jgi:hypothetical protein
MQNETTYLILHFTFFILMRFAMLESEDKDRAEDRHGRDEQDEDAVVQAPRHCFSLCRIFNRQPAHRALRERGQTPQTERGDERQRGDNDASFVCAQASHGSAV